MTAQNFGTEKRIQSDSLSVRVADAVREAIISGELRQGESITQGYIAQMFSVSTMPAREALQALAHEGMVDASPNRGFRVARMGREDIEDIYWAHSILAGQLARRACERRSDELLHHLSENLERSEAAWARCDLQTLGDLKYEFHRSINAAADSPKLVAFLTAAMHQIPRSFYSRLDHDNPEWERTSLVVHGDLLGHLRRRSLRKAEETARTYVLTTGAAILEVLTDSGFLDQE